MNRRRFLALAGSSALLAGCADTTDPATATPTPTAASDLPDGVYVQPYREGMAMQGTADAGDLRVAFMYTSPHRFWNVNGNEVSLTERSGNVHAMAAVWEPETGRVVPETGLSLEIERDGDLVSQEVIYPMLSQRMGYHYGGNFDLSGGDGTAADGEYTARVSVGGVPDAVALTGAYEGRFRAPATAEIPFVFDEEQRERVRSEEIDAYGQPGAVRPMDMMMPQAVAPPRDALPGTVFGAPNRDDALLATGAVSGEAAARFGADTYLYVSPRTRYNGLELPAMALSATVGGETVELRRTLDPELGFHYGAAVGELSGDIELSTGVPPQVARHEGYERAFLEMPPATVTV
ncbi:DUF7350 domain-containing protein [Halosegnis marinus]|uniref:DUF7350 domain-containing protein n=1 Tax=Halosegnis marinus TaxID=3034023 RepID=A0ABD5ZPD1_9EURY|nr:fe2+ transport protein [Halosegnis sp. DT85]